MTSVYDFEAESLSGAPTPLSSFRGRVLLIVNTASQCGFTPQLDGLEALHRRYADRGFSVLGFPCNQFGGQEPLDGAAIGAFCETRYGVDFPLFAKIDVNGPSAHPLYRHLTAARPGLLGTRAIKWNFTKFLVDRRGAVRERFAPTVKPDDIAPSIETLLAETSDDR